MDCEEGEQIRMGSMPFDVTPDRLERLIEDQRQLAALTACEEVRAMHLDLVALYKAQRAYMAAMQQLSCEAYATSQLPVAA